MPSIPPVDPVTHENSAPHLFILGAGASRATLPSGDPKGLILPLMGDLASVVGLTPILSSAGLPTNPSDFEAVYDDLISTESNSAILNKLEGAIRSYFYSIELPSSVTLYDYLLCSLRSKDVIATFNWDPLLELAYERNRHLDDLPKILFLHGNVAIGICYHCKVKTKANSLCPSCYNIVQPSDLLFPVRDKDYTKDPFIRGEWDAFREAIRTAYLVTIFGYSAPDTDAAAQEAMLEVWNENPYKTLAQFEIVDIRGKTDLHAEWSPFITRDHYDIFSDLADTYLFRHPRRSCEAFASASLMLEPWPINRLQAATTLPDLHDWLRPLIEEEVEMIGNSQPLSSVPKARN